MKIGEIVSENNKAKKKHLLLLFYKYNYINMIKVLIILNKIYNLRFNFKFLLQIYNDNFF